jgi:hypothetical protein
MPGQAEGLRRRTLELQKSSQDTQRILELLKTAPEDVAEDLFRNLRLQGTPTSAVAPNLVQPSNAITGLDMHYPNAFPVLEPLGIADIDLRFLGLGVDDSKHSKRPPQFFEQSETRTKQSSEGKGGPPVLELQYDPRLRSVDFSRWTSVPISNSLAARAITFYLANEHPLLAVFNADLFLDDLIGDRNQFCSALFVSSLLARSCVCGIIVLSIMFLSFLFFHFTRFLARGSVSHTSIYIAGSLCPIRRRGQGSFHTTL